MEKRLWSKHLLLTGSILVVAAAVCQCQKKTEVQSTPAPSTEEPSEPTDYSQPCEESGDDQTSSSQTLFEEAQPATQVVEEPQELQLNSEPVAEEEEWTAPPEVPVMVETPEVQALPVPEVFSESTTESLVNEEPQMNATSEEGMAPTLESVQNSL